MQKAARRIVEILRLHGQEAFFAGGWVRDFLLQRPARDVDIATSALPEKVLQLFPRSHAVGAAFGVVQVRTYGHTYDVSTFRTEGPYLDGRHPTSVAFAGARQDARRRDFTVNGLFYDPLEGRVIDYVAGRADLERRTLRTIGNPADRFQEDKLRLLRAVRLACAIDFRIARGTWSAVGRLASGITVVSRERVRDEVLKILSGPNPARGLELLHQSGLLRHILPELEAVDRTRDALEMLRRRSALLGLAVLLHSIGADASEDVCRRLRLSNGQTASVVGLVRHQERIASLKNMRESAAKRILLDPAARDQLELYRVTLLADGRSLEGYRFARKKLRELRRSPPRTAPLITGRDLLSLGYTPGPLFRKILEAVADLALEDVLRTRAQAIEHVLRCYPVKTGTTTKGNEQ